MKASTGGIAGLSPAPASGSVGVSDLRAPTSSGVRVRTTSAAVPSMPAPSDATCGAPTSASPYIAPPMMPPATMTSGRLRNTARRPPWMCATSAPLAMVTGRKSSAMCGAITASSMPVTSWRV